MRTDWMAFQARGERLPVGVVRAIRPALSRRQCLQKIEQLSSEREERG